MIDNGDIVISKDIFIVVEDGDKFVNFVVECVLCYFGLVVVNILNILNFDFVVIGGGVLVVGEFLCSCVEKYFVIFVFL